MKFHPFTSVTRWLLVVFGCAVLETAQPMSAAETTATPARTADEIIYPKNSPDRPASAKPVEQESSSGRGLIVLVALLLAAGGAWVLIQRRQAGPHAARGQRKLQIDETRTLGSRQYLVVASYEGKKFLLGVAPGQIRMLTPLDTISEQEAKS